jgi:hypothetical protein
MKNKLQETLRDKLVRDILTFFYQNQTSVDSAGGVSAWVRDDEKKVQSALDDLVALGVLEEDSTGSTRGYSYTRDVKTMKIIEDLIKDV